MAGGAALLLLALAAASCHAIRATRVPGEHVVLLAPPLRPPARVAALLGPCANLSAHWSLAPARAEHPTDFALVRVWGAEGRVLGCLRGLAGVRGVVPQMRYEGAPLEERPEQGGQPGQRRAARSTAGAAGSPKRIAELLGAQRLWEAGATGAGVRVGVFDTGLAGSHRHLRQAVRERVDWTDEGTADDHVGHGTFVAGLIAGSARSACAGLAPGAELYVFKVFNRDRVSYTSWFLDAFNYAIHRKIHVLNLSIGGPDFMDKPFVEKVWELSANGVTVVSAVGNDGPVYGTSNNPADMSDVIGVGGIDVSDRVALFSSRGMTMWELPAGYGRFKPDLVTYGERVQAASVDGGCRTLSGTSVAAPVVTSALALLISAMPAGDREQLVNPAFNKQLLIAGSERIPKKFNVFEQGQGKMSLLGSLDMLRTMRPSVTAVPSTLDLTAYHTAIPTVLNVTILNSMCVSSRITAGPFWQPAGSNGHLLELSFEHAGIWPWSGWLGLRIRVSPEGAHFRGVAEGLVTFEVSCSDSQSSQNVSIPLRANVVPQPPRSQRLLWDQFHNLKYPPGFLPRDVLSGVTAEQFDWNGDHPHTNMREFYTVLRNMGYYVEVLGEPLTCFNASLYGALLVVDPEDEFSPLEIEKIRQDVNEGGLSVVVLADWYDLEAMDKLRFYDDNTKMWWSPVTGGCNIPALNDLLQVWGIALGGVALEGTVTIGGETFKYLTGSSIINFPDTGLVVTAELQRYVSQKTTQAAVAGIVNSVIAGRGRIAVFGDSSCVDTSHKKLPSCLETVTNLVHFAMRRQGLEALRGSKTWLPLPEALSVLPPRPQTGELQRLSNVIGHPLVCSAHTWTSHNASVLESVVFPVRMPINPSLVPRNCHYMHALGNVTIGCTGCEGTRAYFFESTNETGVVVIYGAGDSGARTTVFSLGIHGELGVPAPVCRGGYLDRSGTVRVYLNELVEVRLAAPRRAGFVWAADPATPATAEYRLPYAGRPGLFETTVFYFRARQEGQVRVNFLIDGVVVNHVAVNIELAQ
eukprot:m51a1_g6912 hypothetical protein (1031) ;mRNA; f:122270-127584